MLAMNENQLDTTKFTLFKRGRKFYARKMYLARSYTVSLGTENEAEALQTGAQKLRSRIMETRVGLGTVRLVLEHFKEHSVHLRESTRNSVPRFVSLYLKAVGGELDSPVEGVFTRDAARRFFAVRLKGKIHEERNRASISANTIMRMTRSLFSARMLDTYKHLPECVYEWKRVILLPAQMPQYTVADKTASMKAVIERCNGFKVTDPEAYKAFWLALHCGLRRSEIAAARWTWITDNGILVQPEKDFTPKNGRSRLVPLSEGQVDELKAMRLHEGNYLLKGCYEVRVRSIQDRIGKVMREEGFNGSKTVHELRKYYGANVATQLGLFAAQKYLGHETPAVTSKYYADLIESKPIEVKILV